MDLDDTAVSVCQGPGCTKQIVRSARGRPRKFCSATCRRAARRQRVLDELQAANQETVQQNMTWAAEMGARIAVRTFVEALDVFAGNSPDGRRIRDAAAQMASRVAGQSVAQATTVAEFFPAEPMPLEAINLVNGDNGGVTVATVSTSTNSPATAEDDPDWAWATSPECPTSWWKHLGRTLTGPERTWLHTEAAHPALAGQIDRVLDAVTARQQALGVKRAKRMTHRDRRAIYRLLTTGGNPLGDVTSALVWAVETPFWGNTYIADKGIPDRPGTFAKLADQWRAAGAPTADSDDTITAAATRLCTVWAGLIGVEHPLPGWTGRAAEALRGSDSNPALDEQEVIELMRWMRQPDNARFFGGDTFPYLSVLVKARGRRRGNQNGKTRLPDRLTGAVDTTAAVSNW